MCSIFRNYNPVERRSKGCKERSLKGSNKSSKSLQANRLSSANSADGGTLNLFDTMCITKVLISEASSVPLWFIGVLCSHTVMIKSIQGLKRSWMVPPVSHLLRSVLKSMLLFIWYHRSMIYLYLISFSNSSIFAQLNRSMRW